MDKYDAISHTAGARVGHRLLHILSQGARYGISTIRKELKYDYNTKNKICMEQRNGFLNRNEEYSLFICQCLFCNWYLKTSLDMIWSRSIYFLKNGDLLKANIPTLMIQNVYTMQDLLLVQWDDNFVLEWIQTELTKKKTHTLPLQQHFLVTIQIVCDL